MQFVFNLITLKVDYIDILVTIYQATVLVQIDIFIIFYIQIYGAFLFKNGQRFLFPQYY